MGADMALALYLRSDVELGGFVSLYGSNPLSDENIPAATVSKGVDMPILMINSIMVKNKNDIEYTSDFIYKRYMTNLAKKPENKSGFWVGKKHVTYNIPKEKVMFSYYETERLA